MGGDPGKLICMGRGTVADAACQGRPLFQKYRAFTRPGEIVQFGAAALLGPSFDSCTILHALESLGAPRGCISSLLQRH